MTSVETIKSQTAIIAGPTGEFEVSTSVPIPEIGPKDVLVKTKAVALNPVDTKLVGDFVTPGCVFGFDCAGIVVAIGKDVKKELKIGDRVCGCASGSKSLHSFLCGMLPVNVIIQLTAGNLSEQG